ncbi:MAG: ABC transporter substrate-binding protein [Chloroflexi bacterium]|nr:ABC transporter substrate-binding protein [Chloroflexota bacterium]
MSHANSGQESQYWSRFWARRASRRRIIAGAGVGSLGLAGLAAVGCGDDDDNGSTEATSTTSSSTGSPAASTPAPKKGGVTRFRTYQQGTLNYDVFANTGLRVHGPASFIYEPLVTMKYDAAPGSFTVEPGLAGKWEQVDATTYTFHLRQDVKFHNKPPVNGRALVAQDVLYSLQRRMDPKSLFYGAMFASVDSVTAPDANTVTIKTKTPFAPFLRYMTTYFATIVAPEVEKQFGDYTKPESAIGTGRWVVDKVTPDVETVYKRNQNYYLTGVGPYVDEHHEVVVLDDQTAIANFKAGDLDYIGQGSTLPADLADQLKKDYSKAIIKEVVGGASAGPRMMMRAEVQDLPFKDVKVRQAISLSLDRDGLLKGLFGGRGTLGQIIGPNFGPALSLPLDKLGEGSKYFKRDVTAAKALLSAAGYANGIDITFETLTSPPSPPWFFDEFTQFVANMKDAGIRAKVELQDYASFIGTTHAGMPKQMGMTGPGALPDPDSVTYRWYYPGSATRYGRVDDAAFTKMLEAQRAEFDNAKRLTILQDIQRYEAVQQQCVYGGSLTSYEAFQPWIKGMDVAGFYGSDPYWGFMIGNAISSAWIDKG